MTVPPTAMSFDVPTFCRAERSSHEQEEQKAEREGRRAVEPPRQVERNEGARGSEPDARHDARQHENPSDQLRVLKSASR
jgi:hypothetical protein